MRTRILAWLEVLGDQFWLRPALIILAAVIGGLAAIWFDRTGATESVFSSGAWGYSGGAEGARALLSAIASSTIGVAGTTFSITVAALSLASGQMGPRLLRNFVRDGRNQVALGIFLGTFAYALIVLRTVRTVQESAFVPHLAVSGAIVLAFVCLATLVWFVHHIATSINVETVVGVVHRDLCEAVQQQTREEADVPRPADTSGGIPVRIAGAGYLQAVDADGLADWASRHGTRLDVRIRPGDYVPAGLPVATLPEPVEEARAALDAAMTFGRRPAALQDLEYAVRQLVEIAVRALSPGINDPFTAIGVLDHLGDALCRIAPRHLPSGASERDGRIVLVRAVTDYDGLCDAMFHLIRQNASGSIQVLVRLLDVLTQVVQVERRADRLAVLSHHADLVLASARAEATEEAGLADIAARHRRFRSVAEHGRLPADP